MWFMHGGVPAYFLHVVRDVLNSTYHNQWINREAIAWLPSSPDLNALDFYLWGHLKSLIYSAYDTQSKKFSSSSSGS
jgi:hypothetical protein